jgi:Lrp/AsnC family leucine-responsive transcriptional regulator
MYRVTGDDCSVLLVAVPDMPAFEALLDRLAGYGQPTSSLVLDDIVAWRPVERP